MNSFRDKTYLITGVTSGIGHAAAIELLENGAEIIGIGRSREKIFDIRQKYGNARFSYLEMDLSNIKEIENNFKHVLSILGKKLDGLVLCAGKEETLPLSSQKNDKIKAIFDINLFSSIEIIRLFALKKYSNTNSSIVIISSVMSTLGQPGKVGYCSTKSAILGLVKASALELAKREIRINAISPGVVLTPMTQNLFEQISQENIERIKNMHPLGFGQVSDISPLIIFLLSAGSRWITGQNYIIDGGYSIQ
ncbi:SDR family oxidoreductase [Schleiferiaceae bacterium]|nr:SDR family oxidoreductase [Schleiferiaceae bacterium]